MILSLIKQKAIKQYCSLPCSYVAGSAVFHENDVCDRVGIIVEGEILMNHYTAYGDEIQLSILNKGDVFGDFLIFSSHPYYPGNLIAKSNTVIITIPKEALETLLITSPSFRYYFLQNLSEKALTFNRDNKMLSQPTLHAKLIYWIESEMARQKTAQVYYHNKTTLAKHLRVRRPSLSREMSRLEKTGKIGYDQHRVWLKEMDK